MSFTVKKVSSRERRATDAWRGVICLGLYNKAEREQVTLLTRKNLEHVYADVTCDIFDKLIP